METIDYKNFLGVANINNSKNQIKARVLDVDSNNSKALVETVDGSLRIKLNNKTGELLSIGDYVVVEYDKILTKKNAYISFRNGQSVPATSGTSLNIENAIVIQEKVASYLLHEYTIVDYIAGNKVAYGGVANPIIVCGYEVDKYEDHTSNTYAEMSFYKTKFRGYSGSNTKLYFTIDSISSSGVITVTFKFELEGGVIAKTASYYTKDTALTGAKIEYYYIYPATSYFPYGYIEGYIYIKCIDIDTGEAFYRRFDDNTIEVGFSSEAEYNAAIGLTYEPQTLSQINETITVV